MIRTIDPRIRALRIWDLVDFDKNDAAPIEPDHFADVSKMVIPATTQQPTLF